MEANICSRCGAPNATCKVSSRMLADGTVSCYYNCTECKRNTALSTAAKRRAVSPAIDRSWDEEKRAAWNRQARESLSRISRRFKDVVYLR